MAQKFAKFYCFKPWLADPYVVVNSCYVKGMSNTDIVSVEEASGIISAKDGDEESDASNRDLHLNGSRSLSFNDTSDSQCHTINHRHNAPNRLAKTTIKMEHSQSYVERVVYC